MAGRPRKFEERQVLTAAMHVFWKNGFQGTSYSDLSTAMGMNRPSIYAAFGDKEDLFLSAVEQCVRSYAMPAIELLNADMDMRTCFEDFFCEMVNNAAMEDHPGCLVTTVLGEASGFSTKFQERLKATIEIGDKLITERLERAVIDGELDRETDLKSLARLINSFVMAFAVRARSGESRRSLVSNAKKTIQILFPAQENS